ncbi:MAG TPA: response regulator, partial [Azospirillum sp.]
PTDAPAGAPGPGDFDLEFPVEHPGGETRWAALRGAMLGDGGPESRRAVGILEDITERRRALEMQLVEAEERHAADRRLFAAIIESSTDLVAALDLDMRFILFNSAYQTDFREIFGRRPQIGERLEATLAHLPDECRPAQEMWSRAVSGERFTIVRDFGDPRHARRTYELTFDTIVDRLGKRIGAFHLARDVTERERARATLSQAEDALRQAQKMEAIGHLTGGIAHDFNNLLQAIGASLYLIESRVIGADLLEPLNMAVKAVERGATLTQHLLAFSRRQRLEPRPVDVDALVRNMGGLLERTLGGTIHIVAEADAEPWPALVDPNQLEMAILNLAINARDAMPSGGTLTIRTANAPQGDGDGWPNGGQPSVLPPGDYVAISVRDTGTGMTDEVASRAFEPFFTTKGVGHGTGLGLSMVHGLAAQSGGAVRLDTRLGDGTMVTLYLPRAAGPEEAEVARAPEPDAAEPARVAGVLLVEDEELVRMATAAFLEQAGFRVVEAASGAEALDIVRGGAPVELVLTDYAMPGMTGLELVRALRAERPELPALMVTGYTEVPQATLAVEGLAIIQKPYRPDDLVARLRAALTASSCP